MRRHWWKSWVEQKLLSYRQEFLCMVACIGCFFFALEVGASTGSSWSHRSTEKPAWARSDEQPSSPRNSYKADLAPARDLAPFVPGSHNIALDLGQTFLMGSLHKYSDSIGTQLHYTYGVSDLFGFDASAGYSEHSDGQFSMATVLTGMRLNLTWYDRVIPYAIVGLGFYRPSYQDRTASLSPSLVNNTVPSISEILFGVHLGPGVDLQLSRNMFFGAAVTFHNMFGTTKMLADGKTLLDVGGAYTSFYLHLGATF